MQNAQQGVTGCITLGEMEAREEVAGQDCIAHTICSAQSSIYSDLILSATRHQGCGKA